MHLSIDELRDTISIPENRFTIYCLAKVALEQPVGDFKAPLRGMCQAIQVSVMMLTTGEWQYHFGVGGGDWSKVIEDEFKDLYDLMITNGAQRGIDLGGWWWKPASDQSDKAIRISILDELINTYQSLYGFT